MGHCNIHNQEYNEQMGGFCPYCGSPESLNAQNVITSTGYIINSNCSKCGHKYPGHYRNCEMATSADVE